MSTQAIQAGSAFVELGTDTSTFQKELQNASAQMKLFSTSVMRLSRNLNSAFSGALSAITPIAPAISVLSLSLSGINLGVGSVQELVKSFILCRKESAGMIGLLREIAKTESMTTAITEYCALANVKNTGTITQRMVTTRLLTTSEIQANTVQAIGTVITSKNIVVTKLATAASWAWAVAMKGMCAAWIVFQKILTINPWTALITVIMTVISGIMYYAGTYESAATKQAKAMEKLREQNDAVRKSAESYASSLETLAEKESLNSAEKAQAKRMISEMESSYKKLGGDMNGLGLRFDETSGRIVGSTEALAKFRELCRQSSIRDLQKEFDALNAQQKELQSKLDKNGKIGR